MRICLLKRIEFTVFCLLALISVESMSKQASKPFPASDENPDGMITLQSEDDGPNLVLQRNIVYSKHGKHEIKLHLVTPGLIPVRNKFKPHGDPRPLVIFVPGSAWYAQNLDRSILEMADFAKLSGYAVAIAAYRPSTIAKSPAQLVDIKTSIRFIRAKSKRFNIDPERIAIWGTSSGGHMASLVGLTEGVKKFQEEKFSNQSSGVSAVINFFGPTNFRKMSDFPSRMDHDAPSSPESTVIGGPIQNPKYREKVDEYNPITYISKKKDVPPFLMMHGDLDPLVPFNQSVLLYEALKDAEKDVTFYKIKGAGHGNRFFTPTPMRIVKEFLDDHFQE